MCLALSPGLAMYDSGSEGDSSSSDSEDEDQRAPGRDSADDSDTQLKVRYPLIVLAVRQFCPLYADMCD